MKVMMTTAFLMLVLFGCTTGTAIRGGTIPSFNPATVASVKVSKEKDNVVSAIYNGDSEIPTEMTKSIPYWVIENGKARIKHIYFKPLYIVVN